MKGRKARTSWGEERLARAGSCQDIPVAIAQCRGTREGAEGAEHEATAAVLACPALLRCTLLSFARSCTRALFWGAREAPHASAAAPPLAPLYGVRRALPHAKPPWMLARVSGAPVSHTRPTEGGLLRVAPDGLRYQSLCSPHSSICWVGLPPPPLPPPPSNTHAQYMRHLPASLPFPSDSHTLATPAPVCA